MKNNHAYKLSDDVVYRVLEGELVVIDCHTGTFYHFDEASKLFFDSCREARDLSHFKKPVDSSASDTFNMLVDKKLIVPCEDAVEASQDMVSLPVFLRQGTQRLDQVNFLY